MPESAILPPKQPLINRRLYKRGIIAVVLIVIVAVALYAVQSVRDWDFPRHANTVGMIAAVQHSAAGDQVVLIKPDGTIVNSPGFHAGVHDRDPVWRPDGNRLFFVSNREADASTVSLYRWNPASNKIERRTTTNGAYTNLGYSESDPSGGQGLVAMNGIIVAFDPITGDTSPILPMAAKGDTQSAEGGRVSSIEGSFFSRYGTSFKEACWFGPNEKYTLSIMNGDDGDTLLLQNMTPVDGRLVPPVVIMAGDRIDMDANRKTGQVVFTLQNFRFPDPDNIPPQYIKDGRVVPPIRHMIGILDPKTLAPMSQGGPVGVQPIVVAGSLNNENAFGSPVFAPDGNSIIVSVGLYKGDGELQVTGLLGMPARAGGGQAPSGIRKGEAEGVSFAPDSNAITFVVRQPDGTGVIHEMNIDGSNDRALTEGKGSFGEPKFSPQVAGV